MQSPTPFDIATCKYYTGIAPFIRIARDLRDWKMQRSPLQFFKPENDFEVREALIQAGRADLIGGGCAALIRRRRRRRRLRRQERANAEGMVRTIR